MPQVTLDAALAQAVCVVIREQVDAVRAAHAGEFAALRAEIKALQTKTFADAFKGFVAARRL
jgi:hypothetical protein